jgi:hypothetical protein
MFRRARNSAAFRHRHAAMAMGLLALWLQFLAFTIPVPEMGAMDAASDARAAALSGLCSADLDGGRSAPAGKSSIPCPQCPLCQTLHILALGSAPPPPAIVALPVLAPALHAWPVVDAALSPQSAPAGFSSRAPPVA